MVHWKGYPELEDQWIPWQNLNAPELVVEFQKENPDVVTHIRMNGIEDKIPVPSLLPPTSLPPHLLQIALMSDVSATLPQGSTQGRGCALSLYAAVAAEVGDDTARSAIIRCIVVLTQAAAAGGASETGMDEEANTPRSQRGHSEDEGSGSVDAGMVLARASAQPRLDHATTNEEQGQAL